MCITYHLPSHFYAMLRLLHEMSSSTVSPLFMMSGTVSPSHWLCETIDVHHETFPVDTKLIFCVLFCGNVSINIVKLRERPGRGILNKGIH